MEKGNKIFYIVLALLIAGSVGVTFYKIVILKNYQIVAQVSCDPKIEKCFVSECDPTTDDTCLASSTVSYYKNISKKANTIYLCEKTEEKNNEPEGKFPGQELCEQGQGQGF